MVWFESVRAFYTWNINFLFESIVLFMEPYCHPLTRLSNEIWYQEWNETTVRRSIACWMLDYLSTSMLKLSPTTEEVISYYIPTSSGVILIKTFVAHKSWQKIFCIDAFFVYFIVTSFFAEFFSKTHYIITLIIITHYHIFVT